MVVGGVNHQTWIVRENASGEVLWQKSFPALGEAVDVTATADGAWVVIGGDGNGERTAEFALKISDSGNLLWTNVWKDEPAAGLGAPGKLVAMGDGGAVIAMTVNVKPEWPQLGLRRFSAAGAVLWTSKPSFDLWELVGMVRLPDGHFAVTYREPCGVCAKSPDVAEWDAGGLPLASTSLSADALPALGSDGSVLAGCTHGSGQAGWFGSSVCKFDRSWGVVHETWLSPVPVNGPDFFTWETIAFALFPGGASLTASRGDGTSTPVVRWSAVRENGQFAWQRSNPVGDALATFPDGSFAVAGATGSTGAWVPMLVRADRWGNVDCPNAVPCAGKAANACDDGNGCTSDYCVAPGNCTHTALDDQTPCGDASGWLRVGSPMPNLCKNGSCVSTK